MKTITTLLTAAILVSGAASAMADQQRSDEYVGYSLSVQAAQGSGGAYASAPRHTSTRHVQRGPYASSWSEPNARTYNDFGNDPAAIQFQEQGSH